MAICQTCNAIPFHNLPLRRKVGRHQPTLGALEESSTHCSLCSLILSEFNRAMQAERGRHHHYKAYTDELLRDKEHSRTEVVFWGVSVDIRVIGLAIDMISWNIAVGTNEGDPLASKFIRRPVHANPASEASLSQALRWIEVCNATHKDCTLPRMPEGCHHQSPLPTRVLDVGDGHMTSGIRLFESNGHCARYIALSYCWGIPTSWTTTLGTLAARRQGIDAHAVPKTYQDAIAVTRQMGVKYLWIDALCIIQDDLKDWERESANMASIYANAYLTVAASNAPDSSLGFLRERAQSDVVWIDYGFDNGSTSRLFLHARPFGPLRADDSSSLEYEPLNKRAWTLQEHCLSNRVLHYGSSQMFFECTKHVAAEDGAIETVTAKKQLFHITDEWKHTHNLAWNYMDWTEILMEFSTRQLTRNTDRLPALSGLASVFVKGSQDKYCAGLWWEDLRQGLLWQIGAKYIHGIFTDPPLLTRSGEWRAPSWSPLSVDAPVEYLHPEDLPQWDDLKLARFLDCHIQVAGENSLGAVSEAWIHIHTALSVLVPQPRTTEGIYWNEHHIPVSIDLGDGEILGRAHFDTSMEPSVSLFALFLRKPNRGHGSGSQLWDLQGLMIEPVGGANNRFRRIGAFHAKPTSYSGHDNINDSLFNRPFIDIFLI